MSNEQRYYDALHSIAKKYQTSAQIRKNAGQYGCGHLDELEMIYENVQAVAKEAIRGKRRPQS
jgi:hypothetical protein